MRFATSAAYTLALALASPFLLQVATAASVKGQPGAASLSTKRQARNRVKGEGATRTNKPKRRRLNGKGKGKGGGGGNDDFYRYPCEFCGEGNGSELDVTPLTCFSGDMTVEVLGRGRINMKELQVGDQVLTQEGIFERVYSFGHHVSNQKATFMQIHTDNGEPLELTQDHMVYLVDKENSVRAVSVKVGDVLKSVNNKDGTIRKIETVQKTGIYAPLTLGQGNIVVNDILASNYIGLQPLTNTDSGQSAPSNEYVFLQGSKVQIPIMSLHQYVEMAIAPYRMFCRVAPTALCDTTEGTTTFGMPVFIRLGILFNLGTNPNNRLHPLFILSTIVATGPFWLLEKALFLKDGSISWAFLAVAFFTTAGLIALKRNRISFVARKLKAT